MPWLATFEKFKILFKSRDLVHLTLYVVADLEVEFHYIQLVRQNCWSSQQDTSSVVHLSVTICVFLHLLDEETLFALWAEKSKQDFVNLVAFKAYPLNECGLEFQVYELGNKLVNDRYI